MACRPAARLLCSWPQGPVPPLRAMLNAEEMAWLSPGEPNLSGLPRRIATVEHDSLREDGESYAVLPLAGIAAAVSPMNPGCLP